MGVEARGGAAALLPFVPVGAPETVAAAKGQEEDAPGLPRLGSQLPDKDGKAGDEDEAHAYEAEDFAFAHWAVSLGDRE